MALSEASGVGGEKEAADSWYAGMADSGMAAGVKPEDCSERKNAHRACASWADRWREPERLAAVAGCNRASACGGRGIGAHVSAADLRRRGVLRVGHVKVLEVGHGLDGFGLHLGAGTGGLEAGFEVGAIQVIGLSAERSQGSHSGDGEDAGYGHGEVLQKSVSGTGPAAKEACCRSGSVSGRVGRVSSMG